MNRLRVAPLSTPLRVLGWALALAGVAGHGLAQDRPAPAAPPPLPPGAAASAPATTLPGVEVRATRASPNEERRQSTAAKIIIGRDEIEQFGDTTLGDVLRRLPGVTQGGRPGRGGELRMRGMGGGYTQILVDGQRAPRGFAIDQLDPELVERIEVLRAPTAETGTRAVAGTINIVLREPLQVRSDELRAGFAAERGRVSPGASWTRNDRFGDQGSFNLTLGARQGHQRTDTLTHSVDVDDGNPTPGLDHSGSDSRFGQSDRLSLSSQLRWADGPGEHLTLQPFWAHSSGRSTTLGTLAQTGGATPAPYARRFGDDVSSHDVARLTLQLNRRIADQTRVELRGSVGRFQASSRSHLQQVHGDGTPVLRQDADTELSDRSALLSGKWLQLLGDGHNLVAGTELERQARVESAQTRIDDVAQPGDFGDALRASTRRLALYLQDEWEPSANWSANAGLRAEQIQTFGERAGAPVRHTSRVISPLAHLVWRFDAPRRDQLRLSLTQSYRPPTLQNLIAVPRLNTRYPAPGPNTASNPDAAGNPGLRPERAQGIDLALERYFDGGGVVSVNLFHRRIRDLIRNVSTLEGVPWATSPRWVSRPSNLGRARTQGLEFDAKFKWSDLQAGAPAVNLRANLSLYRSRVEAVPGPDNRIEQQPRALANLGADHRFRGTAWSVGGSLAFTPGYRTQLTELQSQQLGPKRVMDAYLLWQIEPRTRLRLSLANLAPRDSVSSTSVRQDTQTQTLTSIGRTDLNAGLRLELRL